MLAVATLGSGGPRRRRPMLRPSFSAGLPFAAEASAPRRLRFPPASFLDSIPGRHLREQRAAARVVKLVPLQSPGHAQTREADNRKDG